MAIKTLLFLLICISSIKGQSVAVDTVLVKPGDGTISGKRFSNYGNIWQMTDIDQAGATTQTGIWYDTVRIANKQGWVADPKTMGKLF